MPLQALLVSKDDSAAEALSRVLAGFTVAVERSSDPEVARGRLSEQQFDEVIVDFDDPQAASMLLQHAHQPSSARQPVTVALLTDQTKVREALGTGANFVLYKPISPEKATAGLRAATALLKRERRRSLRVSVQAPVLLTVPGGQEIEGIVLDLSENGMDVLAAQPLATSALIGFRFTLPDGSAELEAQGEVAWAIPNGQSGVRFLDMEGSASAHLKSWLAANLTGVPPEETDAASHGKLTDLSLNGCYVESESPFPERALIDLCLKAAGMEIHAEGRVRVMHPGYGMGIEFPSRTSEQRERVRSFIEFLTSRPGTLPELLISPKSLAPAGEEISQSASAESEEVEDPLLELLRTGQNLSREEFFAELQRQRNSQEVTSA